MQAGNPLAYSLILCDSTHALASPSAISLSQYREQDRLPPGSAAISEADIYHDLDHDENSVDLGGSKDAESEF